MLSEAQLQQLKTAVYQALQVSPAGLSEYELLQTVSPNTILETLNKPGNTGLFQRHFVLKHVVYILQKELLADNEQVLVIEPLKIQLNTASDTDTQAISLTENTSLSDYYLNWNNFSTEEAEIDELLEGFWRNYAKYIQQDEAWEVLNLDANSSFENVTKRYRELAAVHHPDKGGEQEKFIKIRAAYEALKITLK